ncbi:unnamed protein product, partial [Brenthis ino]
MSIQIKQLLQQGVLEVVKPQDVTTLEQLVRQLEREVGALESRACGRCARADAEEAARDARSDTESVTDAHAHDAHAHDAHARDTHAHAAQAQVALLKEQLERAEAQLQARAEEIASLRQETRAANLARWRKEKEFEDVSLNLKIQTRDLKKLEERFNSAIEARRSAEEKAALVHKEITTLKPQYELVKKEAEKLKELVEKLKISNETLQAEVDRSRNDIRKLKSEVQYSEKRRLHAEEQEELSSRERAQLRDELAPLRVINNDLVQVSEVYLSMN